MTGLIVDNFAGGGGASMAIEMGLGRGVDIAINHDPAAIAMHKANHPDCRHLCRSVFKVDPKKVTGGQPVDLAWFSPDCTHFSAARGGKPKKKSIRDLAWVVVKWAERVKPRVIILENVKEFRTWGPLDDDGQVVQEKRGQIFDLWVHKIKRAGYEVDFRNLKACDYGTPTTRTRLFMVARCDGQPIVWPEPTHGPKDDPDVIAGLKKPWCSAAEIIDWSLPCPSIFLTREEARELYRQTGIRCNRPLADKTMARIARGLKKFVLETADPFIVPISDWSNETGGRSACDPLSTVTANPKGGKHALVVPALTSYYGTKGGKDLRTPPLDEPLRTQTSENRFGLVEAFLAKHYGGVTGQGMERPFPTITGRGTQNQIVAVHMERQFGKSAPAGADDPVGTITEKAKTALVASHLVKYFGRGAAGRDLKDPTTTLVSKEQLGLVSSHLTKFKGTAKDGSSLEDPLPAIQAQGNHIGEVRAFLMKYYGEGGQLAGLKDPIHGLTAKARMGLVTVEGTDYQIVDIGMRMLKPHELFRAMGAPENYIIDPLIDGKPMGVVKQVAMCGNSVARHPAQALVAANFGIEQATSRWQEAAE